MNTKEQALKYREMGLSVIPIYPKGKKTILPSWKEYQTRLATEEEINAWFDEMQPDANIGIVTGKLSGVCVIDIDSEDALVLAQAKGLPKGPMAKSGKGYHLYCKHKQGLRNSQQRDDLPGIDVRAEGGCIVAPPSVHESDHVYHWIEGCEFNRDDLPEVPDWIIAQTKFDKLPIETLLKGVSEFCRNKALARLTWHWAYKNPTLEHCLEEAREWNKNNNPPIEDDKEIVRTVTSSFKLYPGSRKGSEASESSASKVNYSAHFEGLIDIVDCEGAPAFLIKEKGQLIVAKEWNVGNKRLIPPPKGALKWKLPKVDEVLKHYCDDSDRQLFDDLYTYQKSISELPSEKYYDLVVAWVFHTYLLEHFPYTPYLYFFAVAERGKSRTGKSICYVSYRGYRSETVNEAQILRLSNDAKVTLFLDTKDLWKVAERKNIQDILLGRFEKDSSIPRVLHPDKGAFQDMVYFDVFGPTVIATNVKVDEILETRAIEINMPETDKLFDNVIKPEHGVSLRERLVAFRARHIDSEIPFAKKVVKGRLGDIIRPLHQTLLLINPDKEKEFLSLVAELDEGRKLESSMSIEAEILTAIDALRESTYNCKLGTDDICRQMNLTRPEKYQANVYSVGRKLSSLGFKRGRLNDGAKGILLDEILLNKLLVKYGLKIESEDSESSQMLI